VAAAVALAAQGMGQELVTFDMGGTSTDIALITEGEAPLGRGRSVGGERIALESLDIVTLGAGGGSIGHIGPGGTLQVGPRSAGAVPGPAAYGAGGTEPTVTDANLVLGYLDAGNFLGGARKLDRAAAELDPAKRLAILAEAERMAVEVDLPILTITHFATIFLYDPARIRGITRDPSFEQRLSNIRVLKPR
jgi:N-methylhydantoinase A